MNRSVTIFVGLCICFIAACSKPPEKPAEKQAKTTLPTSKVADCNLLMGWDPWEPYMYLTPGDQVSGLDIELIKALAKEANCKLSFTQDDWMSLLKRVETGDVSLVAGASITEKRKEYALFSAPYRDESFVLYVRAGEADAFKNSFESIADAGRKIGVTTDYIYGEQVSKLQDSEQYSGQFVYSAVGERNYYNLTQHNVDVIIEDPFVGAYNIKRKGLTDQIEQLDITIHSGEVHLMFSLKSVDHTIVERFNEALKKIKQNGTYQKILNKYLL
ncbi:MAG: amino acid ABC transporter substrate-binding protein [Gammaproteobacteria bacterium]|nr:amino acid ABC transporter substrate-binding protein [Gammaproteobacteria bacterium]